MPVTPSARLGSRRWSHGKAVEFEAKGRTLVYSGWLKLLDGDQTDEHNSDEPTNPIPDLEAGQRLPVARGKLLEKQTQPPSRYTQASLINKLESAGIGRRHLCGHHGQHHQPRVRRHG